MADTIRSRLGYLRDCYVSQLHFRWTEPKIEFSINGDRTTQKKNFIRSSVVNGPSSNYSRLFFASTAIAVEFGEDIFRFPIGFSILFAGTAGSFLYRQCDFPIPMYQHSAARARRQKGLIEFVCPNSVDVQFEVIFSYFLSFHLFRVCFCCSYPIPFSSLLYLHCGRLHRYLNPQCSLLKPYARWVLCMETNEMVSPTHITRPNQTAHMNTVNHSTSPSIKHALAKYLIFPFGE